MAIHPYVPQHTTAGSSSIESLIQQGIQAVNSLNISSPPSDEPTAEVTPDPAHNAPVEATRPSITLSIPLDEHDIPRQGRIEGNEASRAVYPGYVRREPFRRDSLKRREALLKGKEGSRRRQRWENDRLLNNPYAQPPLPSDWEVRPTYPVRNVPYYLAPLWDEIAARKAKKVKGKHGAKGKEQKVDNAAGKVPKELREKLKRSRGAKGLLQDLEEEVRDFVAKWEEKERKMVKDGIIEPDSEDEEIVFVGRNGQMSDKPLPRTSEKELQRDKLIFDSLVEDHGASFGRWLVHLLGTYYGLRTWSVTVGNPARREAYVGIKESRLKYRGNSVPQPLPQPLYCIV